MEWIHMKKFALILINIAIFVSVATVMYHSYKESLNSNLDVDCVYNYVVVSNSMDVSCEVRDSDSIISDESPIKIYVLDTNDQIVYESVFIKGNNILSLMDLEFNSQYTISIQGYDFINEVYVLTEYSNFSFSTAKSDIVIPTYVLNENSVTESEYYFSIDITDEVNYIESIDISLLDKNNELLISQNYEDLSNLDFSFTDLNPETQYSIVVTINYIINDFDEISSLTDTKIFTTNEPKLSPSAVISNVVNTDLTVSFDLDTNNQDASDVTYTIELIDQSENVIHTEEMLNSEVIIDVDAISGNYYISIKASYTLNGSTYTDIELDTYYIYSNSLYNFFSLPTVQIVNTELPLTSYDDYNDYIFTYLNEGVEEFTIVCEAPVDCAELVNNDLYSDIPFLITDLVHAYNDINSINYSYTSTLLNVTIGREYSIEEINLIDQEIDLIIHSIIDESMTDYEKILTVHDYIINNTVYDSECFDDINQCDNDHTAIGVLFDGFAVCEGYSHTVDIMLRALQIPTFRLSSLSHQWSAVYYDGGWYHLDATWDDPVTMNGSNVLRDNFFLITSAELDVEDSSASHDYNNKFVNFME
jgi:hypothetical protein